LDNFNKLTINNSLNTIQASQLIEKDVKACLFAVDTWDAPYITQLDKSKQAKLIAIDGQIPNYNRAYVDKSHYDNLDNHLGTFDSGVDVLSMQPILVATKEWVQKNSVVFYDIIQINRSFLKEDLK
jgi:hypothetical protein